ncbi:MAG: hypothetical protein DIZ80_03495 [endosymbiont of Galathealinum brachiosum]|uniref:DUF2157 domain-containing protein n=1 Tax=endosymbiont of Galathealinum brachiosum TaxID=2200906 RepID=A0A370DHZ5_9GAMM|nr:MAG: hypothetical protein DIZ80_03495 [endosymbiont of Galathealinum brachiosum]
MISKSTLQKASDKNIINKDQIEPLYQFIVNEQSKDYSENKEEPLKFIRSFGDVFIALGIILLVVSINMTSLSGYYYLLPAAGFIVIAEWLVRVRRLALPGMVILLSILFFINKAFSFDNENATVLGLSVISLSSLLFYLRYKMPFSLLPLAGSLVSMTIIQIGMDALKNPVIFMLLGLITFSIAMWFDSRDTKRQSHLSDSAFWLHLLAAPLIVHGAMLSMISSEQVWVQSFSNDILMIIFFACFFLIALFVDRRAMLVSTQLYAIYALTQLLQSDFIGSQNVMIYVLMALGMFVIFFGTYWYKTRHIVFGILSGSKVSQYVPDFEIQDTK